MFDSFRRFLSDVSEGEKHPTHFEHDDYRLAAAALLVHAAAIDGDVSAAERDKLHAVIKRQFGLDDATPMSWSPRRPMPSTKRSTSITSPA